MLTDEEADSEGDPSRYQISFPDIQYEGSLAGAPVPFKAAKVARYLLWRRPGDARHLRHAERGRRLGREPETSAGHAGHGPQLARTQPATVPLPVARALQGDGRRRGRRVVRVPLAGRRDRGTIGTYEWRAGRQVVAL